jgi:heptosyltransferase-3
VTPRKILIFRTGHLGDTVIALPALWAIRDAFPDAQLTLLTNHDRRRPNYLSPSAVLPENGLIDAYEAYPTGVTGLRKLVETAALAFRLRAARYDAAYYLMPRLRTAEQISRDERFFRLAGITDLRGVEYARRDRLELPAVPPLPKLEPEWKFLVDSVRHSGLEVTNLRHDLALAGDERAVAENWLSRHAAPSRRSIAVAPGTKFASKTWPEDRFLGVVEQLIRDHDVFPIVLGGPEDREKGDRLIASWKRGANAAGELSVRGSAALLERCSLYLGNDTGTMHLAAAVGVPCVAIFASVDWPGRWLPFGERNVVFRSPVACEGCYTPDCPNDILCLRQIDTGSVIAACSQLLETR